MLMREVSSDGEGLSAPPGAEASGRDDLAVGRDSERGRRGVAGELRYDPSAVAEGAIERAVSEQAREAEYRAAGTLRAFSGNEQIAVRGDFDVVRLVLERRLERKWPAMKVRIARLVALASGNRFAYRRGSWLFVGRRGRRGIAGTPVAHSAFSGAGGGNGFVFWSLHVAGGQRFSTYRRQL